ncbi:MAG: DinB family protein [Mongoliitalea sp.]
MNASMMPSTGEYHPYYQSYLEKIRERDIHALILDQIEEVRSIFKREDESWAETAYAAGKWTPKEVLAHITDTDRVMAFRAFCFARGEEASLPGFDQDIYIANGQFNQFSVESLLEDFTANRKAIAALLHTITKEQLLFTGTANENKVSVRALIAIIPGHAAHHLSILQERYQ